MKTSMFTSIMLSTLFCATLLSTTFVMPLLLSARNDAGAAGAADDTRTWIWERTVEVRSAQEGPLDIQTKIEMHRDLRFPQSDVDVPSSGSAAGRTAAERAGPDAAMIKSGRGRARTIRA